MFMNNKEASEIILNQLKSWGYKLYNIKYSDRYFIFGTIPNQRVQTLDIWNVD